MAAGADSPGSARPSLREPLLTFAATTAVAAGLFWSSKDVPFLHNNLHAFIAVLFYYAPVIAGRLSDKPFDFREAGLTLRPLRTNLAVLAVAIAIVFPLFIGAFFGFYGAVCAPVARGLPVALSRLCPGGGWLGWTGGHLHLPSGFLLIAANQVLIVAVPEEVFFRGYLLERLEAIWPPGVRVGGAKVGMALLASSVLFALGHVLVDLNPQRLAVFFPALIFAWIRARTGSLAAGAAFHALCNLLSETLHTSYF